MSWRTSTSSSTSDRPAADPAAGLRPSGGAALAARLRLVHPFPSLLNGAATAALALLAGGSLPTAIRLGTAMTAIQFSIGVLNDLVDAARDGGRRPPKPIPAGLVRPATARLVAVLAAAAGLALSAASGLPTVFVAVAGAACGYAYDLRLSRTRWAWLPLAIALPIVPVYAWLGATGTLPDDLLVLVPIGMLAGGGLAVGNALADQDADARAGSPSIPVRLGAMRAWWIHLGVLGAATGLALLTLPAGAAGATVLSACGAAGIVLGAGILGVGSVGRGASPAAARLGWAVEAVGVAALGVGWLLGVSSAAAGAG
ncbi:MAG TPA: UbiA family prenyltransferase [Candidatus Limnocylindrales bacterium]|nr:UbiA family prenyltransferase [Candidatus Limnocylindrales bacterium]